MSETSPESTAVQEIGEIFDVTRVGEYTQFTIVAPGVLCAYTVAVWLGDGPYGTCL